MKTLKNTGLLIVLFLSAALYAQNEVPTWIKRNVNTQVENATKALNLNSDQQTVLRDALTERELNNFQLTKNLTSDDERNKVYKDGYANYVNKLKAKLPKDVVAKITQFQADKTVEPVNPISTVNVPAPVATTNQTKSLTLSKWAINSATKKVNDMTAELQLTEEQKKVIINEMAIRNEKNAQMTANLTSYDEKKPVYDKNRKDYIAQLKQKLPQELATRVVKWEDDEWKKQNN